MKIDCSRKFSSCMELPVLSLALMLCAQMAGATPPSVPEVRMTPCGDAQAFMVQPPPGYNAWPMVQTLGGKAVCIYSRGSGHTVSEGARDAYARTSTDGGRTWKIGRAHV